MIKKIAHQVKRAHEKQITPWKAIVICAFVAGFASALILTVSNNWFSKTLAATVITNQAFVTYKSISGTSYSGQSNQVQTTISAVTAPTSTNTISLRLSPEGRNIDATTNLTILVYQTGTIVSPVLQTTKTLAAGDLDIDTGSLTSGTYDFKVVAPRHLSVWLKNKTFTRGANLDFKTTTLAPKAGNLQDGDDVINALDWAVMSAKWGTNDVVADINKDGVVNTLDWGIMNKNWLAVGA